MTAVLMSLSTIGLVIATYFTAIAYRWLAPDARWIPSVCRMEERTCAAVVFTPSARVFGPPNSLLGQVYYAALMVTVVGDALGDPAYWRIAVAASLVTVGLGLYLTYMLLVVLKAPCPLCFASHAINAVICGLLLMDSARGE